MQYLCEDVSALYIGIGRADSAAVVQIFLYRGKGCCLEVDEDILAVISLYIEQRMEIVQ